MTKAERTKVCMVAKSFLGTPYHHMGRLKGVGVDCGTYLLEVYQEAGLIPPVSVSYYPPRWYLHNSKEYYLNIVVQYAKPTDCPLTGDILLYRQGKAVSHGAIILNYPQIIHCIEGQGVSTGNAEDKELKKRYWGAFTL
jgi:cell wall-associated NlpC family hydrolase